MLKHGYISLTGVEDMEFPNKAQIYVSFHVIMHAILHLSTDINCVCGTT